jgi:GWxTD domain-containing protein
MRFLLTSDERQAYARLTDPDSQSEYVSQFWKSHDPKPETAENELRIEFERRVAFADSRFTQDETRGAVTDRGMVFILLGPPTWIGRRPLTTGDDATDNAGLSLYTRQDVQAAKNSGGTTGQKAKAMDRFAHPTAKILEPSHNWQEVWHYRRELLPRAVPYHQVDFDFLTRRGYGKNVLQREDAGLKTLEAARRAEPAWFVGNKASR